MAFALSLSQDFFISGAGWARLVVALVAAYLLGAVPFAYLAGRLRRVDVLGIGTRNPGAANVFRNVDRRLGVLVALADMAKGALAVLVGRWVGLPDGLVFLAGAAAVVGHWHSPFLGFRGGAGLAVAVGVGLGLVPAPAAVGIAATVLVMLRLKNVGYSAGIGYAAAVLAGLALREPVWVLAEAVGLGLVVMLRAQMVERRWWPLGPRRGA